MNIWIVLLLAFIILATTFAGTKGPRRAAKRSYERANLVTTPEQAMYWRLVKTLPEHVVLTQVGLSRLIKTADRGSFLTIAQKTVDFVVCDKAFKVIAVIEIDDKTHGKPQRQRADTTKNEALKKAGIRLIRWPASLPSTSEILREFQSEKEAS